MMVEHPWRKLKKIRKEDLEGCHEKGKSKKMLKTGDYEH
jgi:hypothetical protein